MSSALLDPPTHDRPALAAAAPAEPAATPTARTWPVGLGLMLVLAGALAVRIAALDRSLWLDETISIVQIDRPLGQVIRGQVDGVHPPLFHILEHFWLGLVGPTAEALRCLSIAWSLVAVVAVHAWTSEAFGRRAALPAAAVCAFAPFAVWYGTELRMYAQLMALVALSGAIAWRVLGRGVTPARMAGLVVALVATAYTHYFAMLFIGTLGAVAVAIVATDPARRRRGLAVAGACALSAVALTPWLLYVLANRQTQPLTTVFDTPNVFTALIAGLQMLTGFRAFDDLGLAAAAWPILCLLAVLLIPRLGRPTWRNTGVVALVVGPPAILAVTSLVISRSAFDSRYLTSCAAPLYVLTGWLLSVIVPARWGKPVAVVLVAVAVVAALWQDRDPGNPKLYELREATAAINAGARPGDAVMLVPQVNELGGQDPVLSYYKPRRGLRVVDTTPAGAAGTVPAAQVWRRLTTLHPGRVFVLFGFSALQYSPSAGRVETGAQVAVDYDRYFGARARRVGRVDFANARVVSYAPNWSMAR